MDAEQFAQEMAGSEGHRWQILMYLGQTKRLVLEGTSEQRPTGMIGTPGNVFLVFEDVSRIRLPLVVRDARFSMGEGSFRGLERRSLRIQIESECATYFVECGSFHFYPQSPRLYRPYPLPGTGFPRAPYVKLHQAEEWFRVLHGAALHWRSLAATHGRCQFLAELPEGRRYRVGLLATSYYDLRPTLRDVQVRQLDAAELAELAGSLAPRLQRSLSQDSFLAIASEGHTYGVMGTIIALEEAPPLEDEHWMDYSGPLWG